MRLIKPVDARSRAHPVLAVATVIAIAGGAFWALLGPFQPGWNAVANNGNGSGATSSALAAPAPAQQAAFPQSFTGDLQGQLTQTGPDANGNVTMQLNLSISNGPPGNVQVVLQGQSGQAGGGIETSAQSALLVEGRVSRRGKIE